MPALLPSALDSLRGMGAAGYLVSNRAVFLITVALCVPTLCTLG